MTRRCGQCQAELPEGVPGNRCPSCLLELGLSDASEVEAVASVIPRSGGRGVLPSEAGATSLTERPGDRIGRYKLLQQIGEGGMGVVYMAEQREPVVRKVALKIIKAGMDTRQVVARFEAERQALALMDHPNIAKVFDGGSTGGPLTRPSDTLSPTGGEGWGEGAGRPYFVMELVQGLPITQFCDEAKLSMRERLELFLEVCSAIQHAHQKGIIHRDIKPSNILVTLHGDKPVPKVIDFGIAKATQQPLTDKTLFTQFQHFIGTPAYMSPEQASLSGLDIDTRSDIYGLGVLLYELLTGQTPFDGKELLKSGLDEMRRTIREKEPPRPSTRISALGREELTTTAALRKVEPPKLIHSLRGDLDWIVMKCLEKDRARRYETANALAMDLRRCMNHEAVVARPPSNLYRLQKLVRRNKLAFAAGGVVLITLLVGLTASTWLYFSEKAAHERAVAAERKAETQAARSTEVARFMKEMLAGVGPSKALGRDTTMLREILDKTAERIEKELTTQPEVQIELWTTLSEAYRDLGLYRHAETMARTALQLARLNHGEEHLATAQAWLALGWALHGLFYLGEAETCIRQGLAVQRKLGTAHDLGVAESLDKLADVLRRQGRTRESEETQREAIALKRKLSGGMDPALPRSLNSLGVVLRDSGINPLEAEASFREAARLASKLFGPEHPDVAKALNHLGHLLRDDGRLAEAESNLTVAVAIQRKVLGPQHTDLARSLENLGGVLIRQDRIPEAERVFREALTIRKNYPVAAIADGYQATLSSSFFDLLKKQKRFVELAEIYREFAEQGQAEAQVRLARQYRKGEGVPKDDAESARWYSKAATRYREAAEAGDPRAQNYLAMAYESGEGVPIDLAEAIKWYRKAAQAGNRSAQENLGRMYLGGIGVSKDAAEAAKWLRKAAEQGEAFAQTRIAALYATGRGVPHDNSEAVKWYQRAIEKHRNSARAGNPEAANEVAWILATAASAEIRDGASAVEFAAKAVALTERKNSNYLDTLAAAYAEAGEFEKAVSVQQEALTHVRNARVRDEARETQFAARLKLYESKTPYRERD